MSLKIILMSFYQTVTVTCTLDGRVDKSVPLERNPIAPHKRAHKKTWKYENSYM
jgi:hypothetical protein